MAWTNPRWGSLVGPDAEALRGIFESLSEWTQNPTFGNATNPTVSGAGVQVQPAALVVKNEWIQSANFATGSAGWQIKANGDAEFNSITVRGTLKTASSGARIEIGTTDVNRIDLYSGHANELSPNYIKSTYDSNRSFMEMYSGANASNNRASIQLNSGPDTGGSANFTIVFTQNLVSLDGTGDFHCFLNGGVARFYGSGGAQKALVDDLGILGLTVESQGDVFAAGHYHGEGDLRINGVLKHMNSGGAVGLMDRGGDNVITMDWSGGGLQFYVDNTHVGTL